VDFGALRRAAPPHALLVRAEYVWVVEGGLAVRRTVVAGDEGQHEFTRADHSDVAKVAAKLLSVLKDVRLGR